VQRGMRDDDKMGDVCCGVLFVVVNTCCFHLTSSIQQQISNQYFKSLSTPRNSIQFHMSKYIPRNSIHATDVQHPSTSHHPIQPTYEDASDGHDHLHDHPQHSTDRILTICCGDQPTFAKIIVLVCVLVMMCHLPFTLIQS